ncbi:MAG TPA: hypothetical protein VNU44_14675 [Bryobacteraceae bacterium]|jgi:hypothetical protein|nr:hypothetical protein [Bryobacteraceae bacterium]
MEYQMVACDRCHRSYKAHTDPAVEMVKMTVLVPEGHITQTSKYESREVHLCRGCHLSFRHWWVAGDPETRTAAEGLPAEAGGDR